MLAQSLIEAYELDDSIDNIRQDSLIPTFRAKEQRFKYNANQKIPRIQHTHSNFSFLSRNFRVLFLIRDLRDTLVSHYRVAGPRLDLLDDFGGFIRGITIDRRYHHDLDSRINFLNSWEKARNQLADFKVVYYEDLKRNTSEELKDILHYIGFPNISQKKLYRIIEVGSVPNMQKLESGQKAVTATSPPSQKVSGKPSSYRDYFTESDKTYFLNKVEESLINTFGYDYERW